MVIENFKPKIIAVTETWFKNTSITNIDGYTLYRKDRSDGRRGGGVCLYIDNFIDSYELNDPGINICKLEQIWSVIYFGNDKYLIGCIYRPSDFTNIAEINVALSLAREYVDKKGFKDLLIMGDFNFPKINWSNGYVMSISNENGIEHKFAEILNENFLYQHVNIPTFQLSNEQSENTLDLIFTSNSSSVNSINSKFFLGNINKGHLILCFDFFLADKPKNTIKGKQKFLFAKSNFENISDFILNIDWLQCFENKNVQEMLNELIFCTEAAGNNFTPIKTTFNSSKAKPA